MNNNFISCDWGTSNLRLRHVQGSTMEVLKEVKIDSGIKKVFDLYSRQSEYSQFDYFKNTFLDTLVIEGFDSLSTEWIVLSGMATSSIGMLELSYSDLPLSFNGDSIGAQSINLDNGQKLLLISGVRSSKSVMRGEEVQAIGLAEHLMGLQEGGVLILPGTHSKHIFFKEDQFQSSKGYMTGELFELLATKSILSNNVEHSTWSNEYKNSFEEGLAISVKNGLSASIFSIRVQEIFGKIDKKANFHKLSGMLIGDELKYLIHSDEHIFIGADEPLLTMYKAAIEFLDLTPRSTFFKGKDLEQAILLGQHKILGRHVK